MEINKGDKIKDRHNLVVYTAVTGVVTRKTGIAFVRNNQIVQLPYVTIRYGSNYRHVAVADLDQEFDRVG